MGIGRREFLRLSSLALTGFAVNPLQAVVTTDDAYINKKLGLLFYKPTTWHFVKVTDFGELKNGQILPGDLEHFKDEIFEELTDPICIMTKYAYHLPEYYGVFSPTITVHINPKSEIAELGYENLEECMAMSEYFMSRLLKDFQAVKTYDPFYISGCKFFESDSTYTFEHVEMSKPVKVELKTLEAEHNGFYYTFNLHKSAAENELTHQEFKKFKESIKLI